MRRKSIPRRIIIGTLCILVSVFAVNQLYDRRYNQLLSFSNESQIHRQACRIWPERNTSERGNLRYGDYREKPKEAQLPSVGEASFLGDPHSCLNAESRLGVYRTGDHDWNTLQWGETIRLVSMI